MDLHSHAESLAFAHHGLGCQAGKDVHAGKAGVARCVGRTTGRGSRAKIFTYWRKPARRIGPTPLFAKRWNGCRREISAKSPVGRATDLQSPCKHRQSGQGPGHARRNRSRSMVRLSPLEVPHWKNFHYDWHWFWPTGNGEIANNGIHEIDIVRWAMEKNEPSERGGERGRPVRL